MKGFKDYFKDSSQKGGGDESQRKLKKISQDAQLLIYRSSRKKNENSENRWEKIIKEQKTGKISRTK